MAVHELKCWTEPFCDMAAGIKRFEVRKNDRNYRVGDHLYLREWIGNGGGYTGATMLVQVTYMLQGSFGLPDDICVMGTEIVNHASTLHRRAHEKPD